MEDPSALIPPHAARQQSALGPYLRAVRSRPWIVLATVVIALAAAAGLLALRSPSYEAQAQMLVSPLPQDDTNFLGINMLRDSGDPTRTVQTAATVIESPNTAAATARKLGGVTQAFVQSAVSVEPVGESNVVAVVAKDSSARTAQRLANTYAQQALVTRGAEIRRQLLTTIAGLRNSTLNEDRVRLGALQSVVNRGDPTLKISGAATLPGDPTGPPDWLVVALALVAGCALGAIAAVLMERVDRRARDVSEILEEWPMPVLARVPATSGTRTALEQPPGVREAFRTLQIQLAQRRPEGATILVTSASSNDGKTTSAINLALALVGSGNRVLLMDFDLRKPDIQRQLEVPLGPGLVSLLTPGKHLADLVQPALSLARLKVVTAAGQAGDHVLLQALSRRMEGILEEAREIADYVVVDTAPLGEIGDTLVIAGLADELVVVGRPGNTDRAALALARDLFVRSGAAATGWIIVGDTELQRSSYYEEDAGSSNGAGWLKRPLAGKR